MFLLASSPLLTCAGVWALGFVEGGAECCFTDETRSWNFECRSLLVSKTRALLSAKSERRLCACESGSNFGETIHSLFVGLVETIDSILPPSHNVCMICYKQRLCTYAWIIHWFMYFGIGCIGGVTVWFLFWSAST